MKKLMMTLVLMPLMALADTEIVNGIEWTFTISGGKATVGGGVPYDTVGAIEIPSVLGGRPVTSIGEWAFLYRSGLTSVTIPESVTSIGDSAFGDCSGLTSVTIPESVTSIGEWAFGDCRGLTSVTIPSSVTSIGDSAFSYCSGLTEFVVDEANSNYSSPNGLLCSKDGKALVAGVNGDVTIPSSVTSIGGDAFAERYGLTSVTIPEGVTSIGGGAFFGCDGLTRVDIANLEKWCGISFGNFYANPLRYANRLYLNGEEVKNLVIPAGVTSIGDFAFGGCSGLTSVTIPSSVTSIGDSAFGGCSGLTSVTILEGVTRIGDHAFEGCSGLTSVTIPSSVTSIGDYAFSWCDGLTSVTIPEGVTSIGEGAFWGCRGLVDSNDFVIVRGVLFDYLVNGRSVTIPSSVTNIGAYAFYRCSGLTSVTIPEGVTSIGYLAFYRCSGLTSVTIPSSVTSIGEWAFSDCSGLTSVTIPEGVTSIGNYAFYGCSGLTSVTIPEGVTSIERSAFDGCSGLTSVTIPSSVTSIGERAFYGCSGLTSVTIPEGVTSIGDYAFRDCSGLTSVTIPEGVTSIGKQAFRGCSGLTSVTMQGDCPMVEEDAFVGVSSSCVVHLPRGNSTYSVSGGKWQGMTVEGYEPLTLAGVLDEPKLADVTTGGDAEWLPIDDATAKVGGSCAVSGALDESDEEMRETWLEAKVYGKGTLTFWWRVSCEPDPRSGKFTYDYAAFAADDEVVVRKDGESDWVQVTKTFATDGEHVVRWTYNTDGWPSDGYDGCVWVDGVTWSGSAAPEVPSQPTVEGDEGATVTGNAETGFVIKPSEGKTAVEVTIPQGVDAAKVTVEVSPKVASVKPNGAKVKIVSGGADITEFLNVPAADGSGVVDLTKATVKEEIVKEAMDVEKGAEIELNAANPSLTTPNTRKGLFYQLREGETLNGMKDGDSKLGDGQPWSPEITVKGGNSAFYSIGVGKGE